MRKFMILAILMAAVNVRGQSITPEVQSSSGASFTADGYTLDWTMGEFSSQTYRGDSFTNTYYLTEGFQQPNYLFVEKGKDETTGIDETAMKFSVYPNPAQDNLYIEVDELQGNIFVEITDITGSLVHKCEFLENKHKIDMHSLNPGIYMLKIYNQQKVHDIIKITKSN